MKTIKFDSPTTSFLRKGGGVAGTAIVVTEEKKAITFKVKVGRDSAQGYIGIPKDADVIYAIAKELVEVGQAIEKSERAAWEAERETLVEDIELPEEVEDIEIPETED